MCGPMPFRNRVFTQPRPNPDPFPFSGHFPIGALSVLTALLADASVVIFAIYRKSLHPAG
jgi:hypothetical protein